MSGKPSSFYLSKIIKNDSILKYKKGKTHEEHVHRSQVEAKINQVCRKMPAAK